MLHDSTSRRWIFKSAIINLLFFQLIEISAAPIILDETKQLFLDDKIIESQQNIHRIIHPAKKHPENPILKPDSSWENKRCFIYGSVIKEKKQFRMWYYTSIKERPALNLESTTGVAYAESQDGIHWKKPDLNFIKIDGKQTNLILERDKPNKPGHPFPYFYELFGVHKSPKTNQYMMGFLSIQRPYSGDSTDPFHKGSRRGLGVATSQDGLHWKLKNSFTTDSICDGDTHWMYDPKGDRYVLYGRTKVISDELMQSWSQQKNIQTGQKSITGDVLLLEWNLLIF